MKNILKSVSVAAIMAAAVSCGTSSRPDTTVSAPADYVTTLMGTLSEHAFSTGNTYPATAVPWGMNFWTPQTGKMGDGWTYRYDAHLIRGFKQTHQPSPWINDYGQFVIMPVKDASKVDEEARASWFSHKSETAKPYYYQVYLADHDINAELAPSDRAAAFRFTFPESEFIFRNIPYRKTFIVSRFLPAFPDIPHDARSILPGTLNFRAHDSSPG